MIKAVRCVKIQLITGYNTDRSDIMAGGDRILGPWVFVYEKFVDEVYTTLRDEIEKMHELKRAKSFKIYPDETRLIEKDEEPTFEEEMKKAREYILNPHNWDFGW